MESPVRIVVVGSHAPGLFMRVHRPPVPGETVLGWDFHEPMDGGKGSHQAIAASLLGVRTAFVGCVGRDRYGDSAFTWLEDAGVDVSHLHRSDHNGTGLGFILLDDDTTPAMVSSLGANGDLSCEWVDRALSDFNQSGVLLTQFEIKPDIALYAAEKARRKGMTAIVNPAPATNVDPEQFAVADILVPNEIEAKAILGIDPSDKLEDSELVCRLQRITGAGNVVVTLGERGAAVCGKEEEFMILPPKVTPTDTSGAGDVFCGALAAGIVEGKNLYEAVEWACRAAALSVEKQGTIPSFPVSEEISVRFSYPL